MLPLVTARNLLRLNLVIGHDALDGGTTWSVQRFFDVAAAQPVQVECPSSARVAGDGRDHTQSFAQTRDFGACVVALLLHAVGRGDGFVHRFRVLRGLHVIGTEFLNDLDVGSLPFVTDAVPSLEASSSTGASAAPVPAEMRIDPEDMQPYTKQQFEEYYGLGCTEWETALPMDSAQSQGEVPWGTAPPQQGTNGDSGPNDVSSLAESLGSVSLQDGDSAALSRRTDPGSLGEQPKKKTRVPQSDSRSPLVRTDSRDTQSAIVD